MEAALPPNLESRDYPDIPCPFKPGDTIRLKSTGEESTVVEVGHKFFKYAHEPRTFCHPLLGTSSGGTCFSNGFDSYELVAAANSQNYSWDPVTGTPVWEGGDGPLPEESCREMVGQPWPSVTGDNSTAIGAGALFDPITDDQLDAKIAVLDGWRQVTTTGFVTELWVCDGLEPRSTPPSYTRDARDCIRLLGENWTCSVVNGGHVVSLYMNGTESTAGARTFCRAACLAIIGIYEDKTS